MRVALGVFKVNSKDTIDVVLHRYGVFIVNFEQIQHKIQHINPGAFIYNCELVLTCWGSSKLIEKEVARTMSKNIYLVISAVDTGQLKPSLIHSDITRSIITRKKITRNNKENHWFHVSANKLLGD